MHDMRAAFGQDEKVIRLLTFAKESLTLVWLDRSIPRSAGIEGFVLDIGPEWLLVANLDESVFLNGFELLRVSDVTRVKPLANAPFKIEALKKQKSWPPAKPPVGLRLDSVAHLLEDAARAAPLLVIFTERDYPAEGYIGSVDALNTRSAHLREIDPNANWNPVTKRYRLTKITRIAFGGRYQNLLYGVAKQRLVGSGTGAVTGR